MSVDFGSTVSLEEDALFYCSTLCVYVHIATHIKKKIGTGTSWH